MASNGSTLKGFATHLEIRTYRTLPASLTLAKFEEHIENAMIAEFEDGELEELYDMNRTRDLAQKELAYRLSPPLRRRFRSSLLRCLSDSFTVSMVQEYLSSTQEYNWLELAPFTIDPDEEDLPANSDMGTFAMILPLLPYDKVSNVDMNTLSDIHELLETNVKLRSLTISLSEKELVFWRKLWAPFFHRLPALETLRIEDHSGLEDRAKFTKIVQDACLPRLVTLVIDSLLFNSQKLLDFLYLHKSTLKEVKLVGAYEIDGQSLRSFLYAARARAWTRQFAWTITESHGPWSASFIHAFQGFIFTNLSIPKHPRDVGRYLM